jgi:hypothetical protein
MSAEQLASVENNNGPMSVLVEYQIRTANTSVDGWYVPSLFILPSLSFLPSASFLPHPFFLRCGVFYCAEGELTNITFYTPFQIPLHRLDVLEARCQDVIGGEPGG